MPSSHPILGHPLLLLPPIPPSIRVFSNESTLLMRWPKYRVSALASFLPKKSQGYLLQNGLVGSPCSPRDSQESSPTPQFKSIKSSALSFLHSPTLTPIHDHWKLHTVIFEQKVEPMASPICRAKPAASHDQGIQCTLRSDFSSQTMSCTNPETHTASLTKKGS